MFCMQAPSWELFTDGQYVPAIGKPLLLPPEQDESFAMEEERDPEKADDPAALAMVLDQDDLVTDGGLSYSLP